MQGAMTMQMAATGGDSNGGTTTAKATAGGGKDAPNAAAQDKILSKGEIKSLMDAGIDVHDLKPDRAGRYDLYKDPKGNILVKPKGGSGPGDPTGVKIEDVMRGGE